MDEREVLEKDSKRARDSVLFLIDRERLLRLSEIDYTRERQATLRFDGGKQLESRNEGETFQNIAARCQRGEAWRHCGRSRGTYCQRLAVTSSGSASGGYITYRGEPGETAILDGGFLFPENGPSAMIALNNVSYITIQGFVVRNYKTNNPKSTPFGIRIYGGGSHIRILDNDVHSIQQLYQGLNKIGSGANGFGIAVYGTEAKTPISDLIIDRNKVHGLHTGSSESLVLNGNVTHFQITRNRVYENNNIGIDIIGYEPTVHDAMSLIYFCHDAGISIGGYDNHRGGSEHVTIVNNTLYMDNAWSVGTGEFFMQMHMRHNIFENNIVYIGRPARALHSRSGPVHPNTPTVTMDHNLFYYEGGPEAVKWSYNDKPYSSFKAFVTATGGSHQIFANPQFADVYKENFHLRGDSPAIGRGAQLGEAVIGARDLDGRPRTTGGKVDMGCYQVH